MNENENEKKPEEGEAAAPESTADTGNEANTDAANEPAADNPASDAPVAEEATPAEATPDPAAEEPVSEPIPDPSAPDPAAESPAPPEAPADPETQPVAAMFAEPVDTATEEPAGGQSTDADESDADPASYAWATQPVVEPDAGAGVEAMAASKAESEAEPEPQPLRIYEYRFIRVKQNTWDTVEAAILSTGAAAAAEAGGQLYGVWAGQVGLSANQGIVVTVWTDLDAAKRNGKSAINGIDEVSASETLYLEPTARPLDATAPEGPGMFAHRIFETRREDTDRFVQLSDEAWPQFEEVFGTKIFALWKETGHDRAFDRLILLTRYNDYAAWENSRYWRPEPDPNASDALAKFKERREITVDTVVYTTRLCVAQGS